MEDISSAVVLLIRQCDENDRQGFSPTRGEMDLMCGEIAELKAARNYVQQITPPDAPRWRNRW